MVLEGTFGWAPWIAADGSYAGLIMTQQPDLPTSFVPSENLKAALAPLVRTALTTNPPVVRAVPQKPHRRVRRAAASDGRPIAAGLWAPLRIGSFRHDSAC